MTWNLRFELYWNSIIEEAILDRGQTIAILETRNHYDSLASMLPTEFYLLNATTLLLWIFQTCTHEVLVLLIALGAIVSILLFCIVVIKLIKLLQRIGIILIGIILRRLFCNYLRLPQQPPPGYNLQALRDAILRGISIDRRLNSITDQLTNRQLSLPQFLALNPSQWSAIEASVSAETAPQTPITNNAITDIPSQPASNTNIHSNITLPTLRRSRRTRRSRIPYSS